MFKLALLWCLLDREWQLFWEWRNKLTFAAYRQSVQKYLDEKRTFNQKFRYCIVPELCIGSALQLNQIICADLPLIAGKFIYDELNQQYSLLIFSASLLISFNGQSMLERNLVSSELIKQPFLLHDGDLLQLGNNNFWFSCR